MTNKRAASKDDNDVSEDIGCLAFFGVILVVIGIGNIWTPSHGFVAGGIAILVMVFATLIRRNVP